MSLSRPRFEKEEAIELLQKIILEKFEYSYYRNPLRHILSFRSDLPKKQLQEITNQLNSFDLNIKAVAGSPNVFSTFNFPARIEINNSYEEIINHLTVPKPNLAKKDLIVDTSHLDAITDIRENIATLLNLRK